MDKVKKKSVCTPRCHQDPSWLAFQAKFAVKTICPQNPVSRALVTWCHLFAALQTAGHWLTSLESTCPSTSEPTTDVAQSIDPDWNKAGDEQKTNACRRQVQRTRKKVCGLFCTEFFLRRRCLTRSSVLTFILWREGFGSGRASIKRSHEHRPLRYLSQ